MSLECHRVEEVRKVLRRLERPPRQTPQEVLRLETPGTQAPNPPARHHRNKKSPSLGNVAAICEAWKESHRAPRDRHPAQELAAIAGSCTAHELTPLHFDALIARWKKRLHRTTVSIYRAGLVRLVRHIAAMSGRTDLPGQVPKVAGPLARRNIAEPLDLARLIEAAPGWLRCAILLAAHGGFRRGDVLRVAPIHLNAEARTIAIAQAKTGHTVTVPLSDALLAALTAAPGAHPTTPFVESYRGQPVTKVMLWNAWKRLKKKVHADPQLTFHDLRRTLAVSLYEVSKDLRIVEQMLGHTALTATVRYLEHRDPQKLKPYVDAITKPFTGRVQ